MKYSNSLPLSSKFTLFPINSEDKILSKYSQVESHMKGNGLQLPKMTTILISIYMVQKLWTKTSVFNKNRKLNLYILWRIYKGRLCTEWIFQICKILHMSFFYNNCNWVINSSFCNPWRCWYAKNNRRTWHKSKFSRFAVYFSIY